MESSGMLDATGSSQSGEVLPIPTQPEEDMSTQLIESLTESMHPEREILIEFKQDTPNVSTPSGSSVLTEIEQEQDVSIVDTIPDGNIAVARIAPAPSLAVASISDGASYVGTIETEQTKQDVMDTLRDDPRIASVQPNYVYELSSTESTFGILNTEPSIAYVSDILSGAPQSVSGINTGIIVGVLDTGIAYNHPELIDKMWNGTNCLSDTGGTLGGCIHGYDFGEGDPDPTE